MTIPSASSPPVPRTAQVVALAGNPNVGKTTIFNRLTGLRQRVGNYPGVTVERKLGSLETPAGNKMTIVDVPGLYSLRATSLDEEIACRVLEGSLEGEQEPDLIVVIVDASNLERNLYLASQILDLGRPTVVVLNMVDTARASGVEVDVVALERELGVPVIRTVASTGEGISDLKTALAAPLPTPAERTWRLPEAVEERVSAIAAELASKKPQWSNGRRFAMALRGLLGDDSATPIEAEVARARADLEAEGGPWRQAEVLGRYGWLTPLVGRVVKQSESEERSVSDRLDAVLTHRIAGPAIFVAILALIFQSVFAWATPLMDRIATSTATLGDLVGTTLPDGLVRDLLLDGVIAGVGAVVIFLPQILILFFFLAILETTGYMARAAFIMDRLMKRVGLSGRSVVPLLSSFACAIPGIMAARTIDNQRDRLVTILVAPLMTCSARLPVYTLLIGAFIPPVALLGFIGSQGLTLLVLYLLGIGFAAGAAWALKRFLVRGETSLFVMELPPYRLPRPRDILWRMIERSKVFLTRAGTIILSISIVLWFLASFPRTSSDPTEQLEASFIGQVGHAIEPAIRPLGYDWKIGVAIVASFAAREVAVSALGTIYSIGDADETSEPLRERLRDDIDPRTGKHVFTPLVAVSLMVFYVLACQCMSTVAVVRRETASWRWPFFLIAYMTGLAWIAAFLTYQGGKLLGFG